jgi:simple sugar transport system ATP-binding protein
MLQGAMITEKAITEAMLSCDVVRTKKNPVEKNTSDKFSVRNFQVNMKGDELHSLNLDVSTSEIFGLTGLSGSGKSSLGYGVMGLCESSGTLLFNDRELPITSPEQMLRTGFFLLPEERHKLGLLLNHSIKDNIAFASLHVGGRFRAKNRLLNYFFPDMRGISAYAQQCISKYSIDCTGVHQRVSELSGGNQQKVSMAHALTLAPSVLFINEPTRGVDIAAKETILEQIVATSRLSGTTVIISSSELDELRRICDRIGVVYRGKLQAIFAPDTDESIFTRTMMGELESVS